MNYRDFVRWVGMCIAPTQFELGYRKGMEDASKEFQRSGTLLIKSAVRELVNGVEAAENPRLRELKRCDITRAIAFEIRINADK